MSQYIPATLQPATLFAETSEVSIIYYILSYVDPQWGEILIDVAFSHFLGIVLSFQEICKNFAETHSSKISEKYKFHEITGAHNTPSKVMSIILMIYDLSFHYFYVWFFTIYIP